MGNMGECATLSQMMSFMRILFALLLLAVALTARGEAVNYDRQSITIALTQEPPNLDSTQTTDLVSFFVLGHVNEGLLRYDRRGRLTGGVAESWDMDDDAMVFHLREDARWSDGSSVTAHDFVYGWRLINDPARAAPYAAIMYPVKNAEKIQNGELPVTELGVRAADDHKLVVQLASPCGYCFNLMVHSAFFPVKQDFHGQKGDRYGAEADTLLYNGPFKLTSWKHDVSLVMEKNPHYWGRDRIQLNEIRVGYITSDNRTRLNLFRDNRIALARLGAETVRDAAEQRMRLKTFVSGGMSYIQFNVDDGHLSSHQKIRKAVQLVFDPEAFVNKVIAIPGYKPAHSFFPGWLNGVDGKFTQEYPPTKIGTDDQRARRLIAEVKEDLGVDSLPALTLLTVSSPTGAKIAEYFQGLLQQSLGLEVKVDQQTFKQYLVKARDGRFDLALASWYPDFDDIITFADLLASWNPNNRIRYDNPEYDRQVRILQRETNQRRRMEAAAKLQDMLIEEVPVLPMAETGSAYVQHDRLRGVIRRVLGADPDYTFARVVEN